MINEIASAVAGALSAVLIAEFLRKPSLEVTIMDIQYVPRVEDDADRTLSSMRKWRQTLGEDVLVPVPERLSSLAEDSDRLETLKRIESSDRCFQWAVAVFTLSNAFPVAKKIAHGLLEKIAQVSKPSDRDRLQIIEQIATNAVLKGEMVGSLRREQIKLRPIPARWKTGRRPLVESIEFSEIGKEGNPKSGYKLRFPTFATRIEYDGDRSDLHRILPFVEVLTYFYTPGIKELLTVLLQELGEGEAEMLRMREEVRKWIDQLGLIVVEAGIENRGARTVQVSDFAGLSLSIGKDKKKTLLHALSTKKLLSLSPRSQAFLTFVSKPLRSDEEREIKDILPLRRANVQLALKTSGHGLFGLHRIVKSVVRALGEDVLKKEQENLLNVL